MLLYVGMFSLVLIHFTALNYTLFISIEITTLSALILEFVFVGSGNGEITSTILQTLMERDDAVLDEKDCSMLVHFHLFLCTSPH